MDQQNMMLMLAASMSEEEILRDLKTAIKNYDESFGDASKKENYRKVQFNCLLLLNKQVAPNMVEAMRVAQKMNDMQGMLKLGDFNNNKN